MPPTPQPRHLRPRIFCATSAAGAITDQGAQVVGWTPAGADPVLWVSRESAWVWGRDVRGGIPICFPWFGVGRGEERPYKHGGARLAEWQFCGTTDGNGTALTPGSMPEAVRVHWRLEGPSDVLDQPFVATYEVTFGATFTAALTVTNTGDTPLDVEVALHTYLAVSDVETVTITGLEGARYTDAVPGQEGVYTQDGPLNFGEMVDRIYDSPAAVTVHDPAGGRAIHVSKDGSATTVVWNPGPEGARAMDYFGDDEWRTMVCVESGNARAGAWVIAPGEGRTLTQRLAVVPLGG